jgi:phosphatidylethanolamine-binding protein (PEBP) family uncharacterized protein
MDMAITSSAFAHNGSIPKLYTCEGKDISPPLAWSGVPAGAKSLAMIVDDPDAPDPAAPRMTWVHWLLYNLPVDSAGTAGGRAFVTGRHAGWTERLAARWLRRSLSSHRSAPLFPQALRARRRAARLE